MDIIAYILCFLMREMRHFQWSKIHIDSTRHIPFMLMEAGSLAEIWEVLDLAWVSWLSRWGGGGTRLDTGIVAIVIQAVTQSDLILVLHQILQFFIYANIKVVATWIVSERRSVYFDLNYFDWAKVGLINSFIVNQMTHVILAGGFPLFFWK